VKEQRGHASIQITVDIYGHLIPGANRAAVDRLDDAPMQPNATQAQLQPFKENATLQAMQKWLKSGEPRRNRARSARPKADARVPELFKVKPLERSEGGEPPRNRTENPQIKSRSKTAK
jgi:hypothetical protein